MQHRESGTGFIEKKINTVKMRTIQHMKSKSRIIIREGKYGYKENWHEFKLQLNIL